MGGLSDGKSAGTARQMEIEERNRISPVGEMGCNGHELHHVKRSVTGLSATGGGGRFLHLLMLIASPTFSELALFFF